MKRELERTQRERNKANLDRDQAVLERDQAKVERDQARRELDMMRAEQLQAERVRENAANCEQLKSELERIQQRQRELDMQKGLQLRNRESPARVDLPSTWGEQPVRSVVISSYKKNTEGRYHRHNRMDWSTA